MAGAQAVLTTLIFGLAIRRGEGGLSAADAILIAIAGGGVVGWVVAEEPIVATAYVIAADLIAAAMMVPRSTATPDPTHAPDVALASAGGALAAGAVGVRLLAALLPGLLLPGQRGDRAAHPPPPRRARRCAGVRKRTRVRLTAPAPIV
jgi:hypothetical protein